MNQIRREPIVGPAVWQADEIGGKSGLSRRLTDREAIAFEELLAAISNQSVPDIRPDHFRHPVLEELARTCRHELADGREAVILTGLDLTRFGLENYRRIYWYVGQLIGRPVAQSERGELIGYVQDEKDSHIRRGYTSNVELGFHTDFHEILSLASVATAYRGGESGLVSSLTVHNLLLNEHPDLLTALYEGWYDGFEAF